jgi:hypothetical protein
MDFERQYFMQLVGAEEVDSWPVAEYQKVGQTA